MIGHGLALLAAGPPVSTPLHGAASTPVPHWVVLLVAVPALWLVVAGCVLLADRLLGRYGTETRDR